MKALITLTIFLSYLTADAQTARLEKSEGQDRIYFSVGREANIRYYVIEGANDSINFKFIGIAASRGNTVIPRNYVFDNTVEKFRNYRIKQIDLNGVCVSCQYIYAMKENYLPGEKNNQKEITKR